METDAVKTHIAAMYALELRNHAIAFGLPLPEAPRAPVAEPSSGNPSQPAQPVPRVPVVAAPDAGADLSQIHAEPAQFYPAEYFPEHPGQHHHDEYNEHGDDGPEHDDYPEDILDDLDAQVGDYFFSYIRDDGK